MHAHRSWWLVQSQVSTELVLKGTVYFIKSSDNLLNPFIASRILHVLNVKVGGLNFWVRFVQR
jgi:hypothetical protein